LGEGDHRSGAFGKVISLWLMAFSQSADHRLLKADINTNQADEERARRNGEPFRILRAS
jgi:hypothetical protein